MKKLLTMIGAAVVAVGAMLPLAANADTYKYKVQYLESTGTQYINTGINPATTIGCRITYEFISLVDTTDCLDMVLGVTDGSLACYPVALMYTNGRNPKNKDVLWERYTYGDNISTSYAFRTRHTVSFNGTDRMLFVDGAYLGKYTNTKNGTKPFYLFAYNNNGSQNACSASRIYGCEFFNNTTGAVIARFIPVVDNDDRPAMFDEVGERLYHNLGTGEFTAGPRKDEPWYLVEYIQSSGTQYIDTCVIPNVNTDCQITYEFMSLVDTTDCLDMVTGVIDGNLACYPVALMYTNGRNPKIKDVLCERYTYKDNLPSIHGERYASRMRHAVSFNGTGRTLFVDGAYLGKYTDTKNGTKPLYFFAYNNNGVPAGYSASRNFGCEFHNSGTLLAEFVPAVVKDGNGTAMPCMYNNYGGTNHFNKGTGAFTTGRIVSPVVPLDLSERTDLAAGLKVFDFTMRPSYGTVFTLDAATAANYDAQVLADGVYLAAKGAGGAAANVITVTGSTSAQFKAGEMPTCASVVLSNKVTLAADCDWTGLGTLVIPDGVTIDLAGHDLTLAGISAPHCATAVITDSSAAGSGGKLKIVVADNDLVVNDRVALLGSLRLVKDGPGRFIAALPRQQYTGGTEVVGGTLTYGTDQYPLGPKNAVVKVGPGAVCDLGGRCNTTTCVYNYDLAGTLRMSTKNRANGYANAYKILGTAFSLSGNATIEGEGFYLGSASTSPLTLALNGYDLTFNVQDFINSNGTTTQGYAGLGAFKDDGNGGKLIVVHGQAPWLGGGGFDRSVAVEYRSSASCAIANSEVSFYDFTYSGSWWDSTIKMKLYGTYHAGSIRPMMEMQDGSTLDLTVLNAPLNANAVANTSGVMTFASGTAETPSVVNVNLAGRTDLRALAKSASPYVVTWSSQPANVEFVLDAQSKADGYRLFSEGTGLRIKRFTGLMILVR